MKATYDPETTGKGYVWLEGIGIVAGGCAISVEHALRLYDELAVAICDARGQPRPDYAQPE